MHPFEGGAVERANTAHGELHYVGGEGAAVADGGHELEEASCEAGGYEERTVKGAEAGAAGALDKFLEVCLVGGVGEGWGVGGVV